MARIPTVNTECATPGNRTFPEETCVMANRWNLLKRLHADEAGDNNLLTIIMVVCVSAAVLMLLWKFLSGDAMSKLKDRVMEMLGIK
jgi:hypothetical protein